MEGEELSLSQLLSPPLLNWVSDDEATTSKKPRLLFDDDERRECERLREKNVNSNTARTTNTWVSRFETWRIVHGLARPLQEIPQDELDEVLQHFYACVAKQDGQDYEPSALKTMPAALNRFLQEQGKCFSIRDRV